VTLPFTTSRVRIEERSDPGGDRWEPAAYVETYPEVVGVLSTKTSLGAGGGDIQTSQGSQQIVNMVLHVNPGVTITATSRITDLDTGDVFEVTNVEHRHGLGLDHTRAGLKQVSGVRGD
jgi:hypothetical protein